MVFCSEAAEWFSFGGLSTPKEKFNISAILAPRAKRAVKLLKLDKNYINETII
jgi:hypothetical protein